MTQTKWPPANPGRFNTVSGDLINEFAADRHRYQRSPCSFRGARRASPPEADKSEASAKAEGESSERQALPAPGSDFAFPFDQDFLIRSGIRDAIRQLILENLLDDRHDLTGNSVYGLKFDISVIPGNQTYSLRICAPLGKSEKRDLD